MKTLAKTFTALSVFLLMACGGPSLEKYYVENQEKDNFVVVNVPSDVLIGDASKLSKEEKTTLKKIEKANVLAFPVNEKNKATFKKEKAELEKILKDEEYKLLMKFGSPEKEFKLMYTGDPEAIDEIIVYGSSEEAGFGVARILGNDMDLGAMMKLVKSLKEKNVELNIEGIEGLQTMFEKEEDSL